MQLTIEVPNEQLLNKILRFLNTFKSDDIKIISNTQNKSKNHKESPNKFSEFSGMWKDRDITQESIRKQAWK